MAELKILGQKYSISNRYALRIIKELHKHLSSHCLECDKQFVGNEVIIPYGALIPGNDGLLCEECAELLNNLSISVEEVDTGTVNDDGKTTENNMEDSPEQGEENSPESST
jgi:hypothetical protein